MGRSERSTLLELILITAAGGVEVAISLTQEAAKGKPLPVSLAIMLLGIIGGVIGAFIGAYLGTALGIPIAIGNRFDERS